MESGETDAISEVIEERKAAVEDIKDSESKEIDVKAIVLDECSYERFQDIFGPICFDSKHIENEYSDDESDEEGDYENIMEHRIEGAGDISEHNLSAYKTSRVQLTSLLSALTCDEPE